ncbi:MAG: BON domain-containing protein, partial [Planctomycetota bacterium]
MRTGILIGSVLALSVPLAAAADSTYSKRMQDAIVRELERHPAVDMKDVTVRVEDAHAELVGTVDSLVAKRRAEWIAAEVRGVEVVDNDLVVGGSERPDAEIRTDVIDALVASPVSDRSGITVSVHDGQVLLTGSVDSWQARQMAALSVMEVEGVATVDNRLRIADGAQDTADATLATQIRDAIQAQDEFDPDRLAVSVEEGVVRISGSVPSLAARYRLRNLAWRPGVEAVVLDAVSVRPQSRSAIADDTRRQSDAGDQQDVAAIVRQALTEDPQLDRSTIDVSADGGAVRLSGTVASLHQRTLAARVAQTVDGV